MRIPFLHNVRRGLATNSSSSHSLVFSSEKQLREEKPRYATTESEIAMVRAQARHAGGEFGWEDFTLDTLGEKLMYALTDRIGGNWSREFTDEQLRELQAKHGHLFPEFEGQDDIWRMAATGYVDHQSEGTSGELETLRKPSVYITGGNDNSW